MIFVDTHVLLWWQAGEDRLSARARRELAGADEILVSPVSCWEVAMLVAKGRIALDRDVFSWVRDLYADDRIVEAPLSPQAAAGAGLLPEAGFGGDPADAFLYAQARELVAPLVTKDPRIREFARSTGDIRAVW